MSLQSQISSLATRIGQECKALWTAVNGKITGANVPANETDPVVGAINGIVKADGAGNISAAVAETDYASPASDEALDLSLFPNPHNWEKDYSPATKNAIGNFLYDIYNDYLTAVSFGVDGDRRTFTTGRKAGSPAISIMPRASATIDGYMSPTHYIAVEDYIELEVVSQAEAEAGTATTARKWTAERVKQAIAALQKLIWSESGNDIYYNDGNVGIGTNSPSESLESTGNIKAQRFYVKDTRTSGFAANIIENNNGNIMTFGLANSGYTIPNLAFLNQSSENPLSFAVNSDLKLTIMPSGNVGIGTSSPDAKLTIYDGQIYNYGLNYNPSVSFYRSESNGSPPINNRMLGQIGFYSNDTKVAWIQGLASALHSAISRPTRLSFATTPENETFGIERMTIAPDGTVDIKQGLKVGGASDFVEYDTISDTLKGSVAVSASNIDWSAAGVFTKTLSANTTFTFSNLQLNKVITLVLSGNYAVTMPSSVKIISGQYDGSTTNYIQLHCTNTSTPVVWCVISQEA